MSVDFHTPPHAVEMEKALLGALLLDGSSFARVADLLDEFSFYRPVHAMIYEAVRALDRHHEPIDLVTVCEQLRKDEQLDDIGGAVYLTELAESMPSSANVIHYAAVVQEKAVLRQLIALGTTTSEASYSPDARPSEVLESLQHNMVKLAGQRRAKAAVRIEDALKETLGHIEQIKSGGEYLVGLSSSFDRIDDLTAGFSPGELVIVAGRPSMGKTSLAMNIARSVAGYGTAVLVFSLEMDVRQLMLRMLSSETKIPLQKLRTTARLTDEEYVRLSERASKLAEIPLFFDDSGSTSIEAIRSRSRQMWMEHKIGMVVIDYLQLILPPKIADSQQQWVAYLSASLKSLAKELGIPVLCLSQLSRAPETRGGDRKPMLSDLRDSGAIEQDADIVMFVYRPEIYKEFIKAKQYEVAGRKYDIEGLAEIIVAKNRNGPTGNVPLAFLGRFAMFAPITDQSPQERPRMPEDVDGDSAAGF